MYKEGGIVKLSDNFPSQLVKLSDILPSLLVRIAKNDILFSQIFNPLKFKLRF